MSPTPPAISIKKLLPLALLAGVSFWFANRESEQPNQAPHVGFAQDVDYYLKGVTTERFDSNGELRYKLDAQLARHFRSSDSVELSRPIMQYRATDTDGKQRETPDYWHIASEQGWFFEEQPPRLARLELKDQVVIKRVDKSGSAITTITDEMWFLPGTGELHSQSPVVIQQGSHRIKAARLSINTKQDRISLHGGVKGAYYPANANSNRSKANEGQS